MVFANVISGAPDAFIRPVGVAVFLVHFVCGFARAGLARIGDLGRAIIGQVGAFMEQALHVPSANISYQTRERKLVL